MTELSVRASSVGLTGPGLQGWGNARNLLRLGKAPETTELPVLSPAGISPRERRRLTDAIKLPLMAAQDALENLDSPLAIEELSTVFASADGDLFIADRVLAALALPGQPVSPTHFHNSVHNAAAGYWHLASHSMHGSTSIAAAGETFSAGFLEACSQVVCRGEPCLLVVSDAAAPPAYQKQEASSLSLAIALVLLPENAAGAGVGLKVRLDEGVPVDTMPVAYFEDLRRQNPAARGLPLLRLLVDVDLERVSISTASDSVLVIGRADA